ncbi:hypothetical protein TNIN_455331 [Trichonephila inaurata madagascariensis]|uniref:Uncharacterized protein n=1 Tax=Trichonephila inaurata madagascariensis TaxID=2747483 RepID=A0A8X6X3K6_9ARAC|nr:hypothetical protein TNIN_455331 [Trichonephila inaurata madagascariensis]
MNLGIANVKNRVNVHAYFKKLSFLNKDPIPRKNITYLLKKPYSVTKRSIKSCPITERHTTQKNPLSLQETISSISLKEMAMYVSTLYSSVEWYDLFTQLRRDTPGTWTGIL